jgi:hypothetical protein
MIYDGFPFFNELDLLEIRLNTLKDVVDKFVLVEAENTFRGNPKPLWYLENKDRFAEFEDKIIHIVMGADKSFDKTHHRHMYENDFAQRRYVYEGFRDCKDDDILILSDLDEIPNASTISKIAKEYVEPVTMKQLFFYHYLNTAFNHGNDGPFWKGSVITSKADLDREFGGDLQVLRDISIHDLGRCARHSPDRQLLPMVDDGGWHFSFVGSGEFQNMKQKSYAHDEFDFMDENDFNAARENLYDPLLKGRGPGASSFYGFVDLEKLPEYVANNKDKFGHMLRPVPPGMSI